MSVCDEIAKEGIEGKQGESEGEENKVADEEIQGGWDGHETVAEVSGSSEEGEGTRLMVIGGSLPPA